MTYVRPTARGIGIDRRREQQANRLTDAAFVWAPHPHTQPKPLRGAVGPPHKPRRAVLLGVICCGGFDLRGARVGSLEGKRRGTRKKNPMEDEIGGGDKGRSFPMDPNLPIGVCQNCRHALCVVGVDSYADKFFNDPSRSG
ncbi:hypothetical protein BHE74_00010054 [Ensete ventricosum]|nr:hypothetical protein BHE74_00010054 [Ensete ventricosum]